MTRYTVEQDPESYQWVVRDVATGIDVASFTHHVDAEARRDNLHAWQRIDSNIDSI